MSTPAGIDPRGPRFAATITALLLLVATFLALIGISTARLPGSWFALTPSSDFAFLAGQTWPSRPPASETARSTRASC